jgi:hypothetical protein
LGGLDGGENHEGKRREEEKENIPIARVEGESSAIRRCLQVSIGGKCDGLLGQVVVDIIDQLFHIGNGHGYRFYSN